MRGWCTGELSRYLQAADFLRAGRSTRGVYLLGPSQQQQQRANRPAIGPEDDVGLVAYFGYSTDHQFSARVLILGKNWVEKKSALRSMGYAIW